MELKNYDKHENIIETVTKGSIAEELGVEEGDLLISINGNKIKDIIDYKYHISDDYIVMVIKKEYGQIWELEIEKEYDEDVGIAFSNPLIDKAKSCNNKCIFCFIDQLPKGMRKTLYFKDDDSRLSFLQGNFITLTNISEDDIKRIIEYRISPINISVHTTDPKLRTFMLNNKNAGNLYNILERFSAANIEMNCQIVLCPGINDGESLKKTVEDLSHLYPSIHSVAVVPVGLTKYREGLYPIDGYNKQLASKLLDEIHEYQRYFFTKKGTRFIYASDEFYILAGVELPKVEQYEGFPQIENGVGLIRNFDMEIKKVLKDEKINLNKAKSYLLITGVSAFEFIKKIAVKMENSFSGLSLDVKAIKNDFFGHSVTVSGLVTGKDIFMQVKDYDLKDGIIIPRSMLKSGEDIFLDDITVKELEEKLQTNVIIAEVNGEKFVDLFVKDLIK